MLVCILSVRQSEFDMKVLHLGTVVAVVVCAMVGVGVLASAAPWLARESLFEFTAREPNDSPPAEPAVQPNPGPDESPGFTDTSGLPT
jgi:hypothetical protein